MRSVLQTLCIKGGAGGRKNFFVSLRFELVVAGLSVGDVDHQTTNLPEKLGRSL